MDRASLDYIKEFWDAYMGCALWSSHDEADESGGEPMDANYGPEDIDEYSAQEMLKDCNDFIADQWPLLEGLDPAQSGHDFWLTRNRHGAGFWDRGLGKVGDELTKAAHVYGECDLYVGDDGKIHVA